MGQDQDAPLITSVTWPREGLTTTGGVPAGVEVRPIWTTSTMCVRELALKISGSRERGTLFTILLELDLSLFRKPCLSALSISCRCCKSCLFPADYVIYIYTEYIFVCKDLQTKQIYVYMFCVVVICIMTTAKFKRYDLKSTILEIALFVKVKTLK